MSESVDWARALVKADVPARPAQQAVINRVRHLMSEFVPQNPAEIN
jgi:hypothetical protein